ncbi:MAG: TIR domain-containing protein [Blautia sp.]|uniref:TIR domain-containing protein n=1 Tax=Blautia sp. TaxID=1955243 RepID=UPI003994965C
MILTREFLQSEAKQRNIYSSSQTRILNESYNLFSTKKANYDLFLSHSYLDKDLVLTLVQLFTNAGYYVYVDWIDDVQLDRNNVTVATAKFIKSRIKQCKGLSYISTSNIVSSKWCPWELGIADGLHSGKACILPVLNQGDSYNGQEYLKLYPYIEYARRSGDNIYDFWVYDPESRDKYIILSDWLLGKQPYRHF